MLVKHHHYWSARAVLNQASIFPPSESLKYNINILERRGCTVQCPEEKE